MNKRIKKPKTDEDWMLRYTATWLHHIINLSEQKDMTADRFLFAIRFLGKKMKEARLRFNPTASQVVSAGRFFGVFK